MSSPFDTSMTYYVPAFTDTVGSSGSYSTDICGAKSVTLNAITPVFLNLTPDSIDPILGDFLIEFDASLATETDVGLYTVGYEVTM